MLQRPQRLPFRKTLAEQLAVARDFDDGVDAERVDHADADAVQAARGGVCLARELAARMERRQDHLQRRLVGKFGMRIDRDAAAVVGDRQSVAGVQRHLDPGRVTRHRLVHGVVDHLGEEVMQRALVGAADVHAGAAADGLEAFEHLDRRRVVIGRRGGLGGEEVGWHARNV